MKKRAVIQKKNCVACGCCVKVCPRSAISVPLGIHAEIDYGLCVGCGKCVKECPASIITLEVTDS
jgi:Pyruvate/2-oxoacid:ferredoxin oxidoreductase delta subunit